MCSMGGKQEKNRKKIEKRIKKRLKNEIKKTQHFSGTIPASPSSNVQKTENKGNIPKEVLYEEI